MLPVYQAFDRVKFREVPTDDARAIEDKLERASRAFADRDGWLAPHQRIVVLRELARLVDEQRRHDRRPGAGPCRTRSY
jgi:acyl-CoA reductase-like NAD-dependent aldehyde dehydrogenase